MLNQFGSKLYTTLYTDMTIATFQQHLLKIVAALCIAIIVLLPFHALLTIWVAGTFGHYTAWRLWKELLLVLAAVSMWIIVRFDKKLRQTFSEDWLMRLIGLYAVLVLLSGAIAYATGGVTRTAFADGVLLDLRFLLFFVVTWLLTKKNSVLYMNWRKLLITPALVVVAFGLLQRFALPYDFLKHFGYGPQTISPYETIDHKTAYIRVQSTLRGANPLGAYLAVVLAAIATLVTRVKTRFHKATWFLVGCLTVVVLFFTYSRSAWLGAIIAVGLLTALGLRHRTYLWRVSLAVAVLGLLVFAGVAVALRNNDHFQNTFFHTDEHSTSSKSSNTGHVVALKNGISDMVHHPLGSGTGTAGPASVHNDKPARIAENYFIQIGQETGFVGLGLFIAINCIVAIRLWRRDYESMARVLLTTLIGISVVCLFSHAWTDDTLAYIWWGFAGVALARLKERRVSSEP
jgi:hypothetical protein